MKIERLIPYLTLIIICIFPIVNYYDNNKTTNKETIETVYLNDINSGISATGAAISTIEPIKMISPEKVNKAVIGIAYTPKKIPVVKKVYNNMTMKELEKKLNKSLNSTLSNTGNLFAKYSIKYGVDPYLAVAIALHETGCKWECSTLVKQCNNVGGQKGSPGCGGGAYQSFSTLEEGIHGFIYNIYNNYYKHGLNTPELMNRKYAASTTWSTKVNSYITSIKNG